MWLFLSCIITAFCNVWGTPATEGRNSYYYLNPLPYTGELAIKFKEEVKEKK